MKLFLKVKKMEKGQIIKVVSYDLGAIEDVPAWCRLQGHTLLAMEEDGLIKTIFFIQTN